jgi:hypothetical protein
MAPETVPVRVAEEAATRVAKLGMQRELEQMIEHAKQTATGLRAISVTLEYDPACVHRDPTVVIWVYRDEPEDLTVFDRTGWDWNRWQGETFPPEVRIQITMISTYGDPDGW